jgi:uncharacterized protein YecE (DUF72 family)
MTASYIGTSGWVYEDWWERFYPKNLKPGERLNFYAQYFNSVEVNASFYRTVRRETFKKWYEETPLGFRFSVKASRYITHILRLDSSQNLKESVKRLLSPTEELREKLAVILWQLPPNFKVDNERLGYFLELLAKLERPLVKNAFEFRHASWLSQEVYDTLHKYNSALVVQDSPIWPISKVLTASFIYLRFHGLKSLYNYDYSEEELKSWARRVKQWGEQKLGLFAYFNNDVKAYAPKNAQMFKRFIDLND